MINPIKQIIAFNKKAGLIEQGYEDKREASFQIEEALEGFSDLSMLAKQLNLPKEKEITPKNIARQIMYFTTLNTANSTLKDVDRLDKACDAVVFAIGSMAKLKLTYQDIIKALTLVMIANLQKLNQSVDKYGKLEKPVDFIRPETELQCLLDKINLINTIDNKK